MDSRRLVLSSLFRIIVSFLNREMIPTEYLEVRKIHKFSPLEASSPPLA